MNVYNIHASDMACEYYTFSNHKILNDIAFFSDCTTSDICIWWKFHIWLCKPCYSDPLTLLTQETTLFVQSLL